MSVTEKPLMCCCCDVGDDLIDDDDDNTSPHPTVLNDESEIICERWAGEQAGRAGRHLSSLSVLFDRGEERKRRTRERESAPDNVCTSDERSHCAPSRARTSFIDSHWLRDETKTIAGRSRLYRSTPANNKHRSSSTYNLEQRWSFAYSVDT
jgi:hypothetical protein